MKYILLLWSCFMALALSAQQRDTWTAFYDDEAEGYLSGFKNSQGTVMITPRFMGFTIARKWDHIAALMEDSSGNFSQYYMLKDGTKFGRDSLYVSDMSFDCESEGYIKFTDPVSGHTGMFNATGKIAIPPVYNDITAFRNGMAVALKGARKKHWDADGSHSGCDHWSWADGQEVLINQKNEVLITGFPVYNDLDMYSLTIGTTPETDSTRVQFRGTDHRYYSFTDNRRYFKRFLETELLADISQERLVEYAYRDIIYWDDGNAVWEHTPKERFIQQHYSLLSKRLAMLHDTTRYSVSVSGFLPIPEAMMPEFEHCYDNCGRWNTSGYPMYMVVINHSGPDNKFLYQDHINFIKLDGEILLIGCSLHINGQ